jgi:hypothetical protein
MKMPESKQAELKETSKRSTAEKLYLSALSTRPGFDY